LAAASNTVKETNRMKYVLTMTPGVLQKQVRHVEVNKTGDLGRQLLAVVDLPAAWAT
jgi:hypothetical protein